LAPSPLERAMKVQEVILRAIDGQGRTGVGFRIPTMFTSD